MYVIYNFIISEVIIPKKNFPDIKMHVGRKTMLSDLNKTMHSSFAWRFYQTKH